MPPSRASAAVAGAVLASGVTATVHVFLVSNLFLATCIGLLAGIGAGFTLWGVPRLNELLGEETEDLRLSAVTGSIAGGISALFTVSPFAVDGIPFTAQIALAGFGLASALVGFAGAVTLIVVRIRNADAEIHVVTDESEWTSKS